MKEATSGAHKRHAVVSRVLLSVDGSQGVRKALSWSVFLVGFILWIVVQGGFALVPLWTRALPPETDDSLSYVLKSRQMGDCYHQDCPALKDLHKQLSKQYVNDHTRPERRLAASRIFPVYHPLFSLIIVGLHKLGFDWMVAYKMIWTIGPLLFGLAFAYLLATMWGLPAAGVALALLAFKVFPDTGLHRVVPSNLAMAMAVCVWARIISQKGHAIWTLVIGAALMVAMHPIGRIYAVMALCLTLSMSGFHGSPRKWIPAVVVVLIVASAFLIFAWVKDVHFVHFRIFPKYGNPLVEIALGAARNVTEIAAVIVRMEGGLFGSIAIFCGAVSLGLLSTPLERRTAALKTVALNALFLFALLFYVSAHPADAILRAWIPLVVILFGALGQAICYASGESWKLIIGRLKELETVRPFSFQRTWPVVALAFLLGYSAVMTLRGAEQVYATTLHMKNRQPLLFDSAQTRLLMSRAKPGDRVLYSSMIILPYYLIHGAMELGAVYYHPVMEGTEAARRWLSRPDLRFAVTYNPTVYHPTFEGVEENLWWTTIPEFYFSPLSKARKQGPISREGMIPAAAYRWIDVALGSEVYPRLLRLMIENRGKPTAVEIHAINDNGNPNGGPGVRTAIPSSWSGWIEVDLSPVPRSKRLRIMLPWGRPDFLIGGITIGKGPHFWPWARKADLIFQPKTGGTGPISVSFDPAKILPSPLNRKKITVLNDRGSSVLFEIHQ